jgi:ABC-type multidrug transport system fused ATPase/permease subunit
VTFENATFSYDGHKEVVHNISFTCKGGQTIALVGDTGAGKSTILRLLFRFYDVNKGAIYIDGQDIRDVTLESLRDGMGVVSQDPTLFNNTIMSNVRYARLDATDAEVMEACRAAAVHDKILTFHEGYHTRVGERGVKLSGGELQRLAIARAILKDPKIILLDEATSAVDSVTEGKIQDALRKLCRGRTTFVVAHRLSTIIDADVILVFRDGAIVEQGSPKELVQMKKEFYRLWSKQIGIVDGRKDTEGDA